jgi:hypothetical protein
VGELYTFLAVEKEAREFMGAYAESCLTRAHLIWNSPARIRNAMLLQRLQ